MSDAAARSTPAQAAAAIPAAVRSAQTLPEPERKHALRQLLSVDVHDVAMHATVSADAGPEQLAPLAEAVRSFVPAGVEEALNPRTTVFVRLLRHGALDPAWMLAHDNASGVVRSAFTASTWAGGSILRTRLPLPTIVDPGPQSCVHAWLPGFRDPRWELPDELYDVTARVVLRGALDQALLRDRALHLFGAAYLGLLTAGPHDRVTLHFTGPVGSRPVSVEAARGRRPDLVQPRGPELTRLAWGGWSARVDLAQFAAHPGTWRGELELEQQGVRRRGPLGQNRGPLANGALLLGRVEACGQRFSLGNSRATRGLTVQVGVSGRVRVQEWAMAVGSSAQHARRRIRAATAARG